MIEQRRSGQRGSENQPPPVLGMRPSGGPMGMLREVEKAKNAQGTLARLWGYLQRQRGGLVGTALLVVITTVMDLLGPFLMGKAIDAFIVKGDLSGLARLAGLMMATYIYRGVGGNLAADLHHGRGGAASRARLAQRSLCQTANTLAALF
jgi:ATP-binding cassette subfamily B multidrug efflux pump